MATSIKVHNSTKREIEKIQAELLLKYNRKMTQQEIVDLLVKLAAKDISQIIDLERKYVLTHKKLKRLLKIPKDLGVETDSTDIDDIIYGEL